MKNIIKWIVWIFIFSVIGSCMFGGNHDNSNSSSSTTKVTQSKPVIEKTLQQKALEDSSQPVENINALRKGIQYAKMMHMSKQGVYDQLTSEYGEKFNPESASWAIAHMSDIDWNANALEKAKTYQKQMAMSKEAIREQLISSYGEKFTEEEAQYAIDNLDK